MTVQKLAKIEGCLDRLLPREKMILSYDRSFIDDLPVILRENYGVKSAGDAGKVPALQELLNLLGQEKGNPIDLATLPALLEAAGVEKRSYIVLAPEEVLQKSADTFSQWSTKTAGGSLEPILALQKDLGMGKHNETYTRYPSRMDADYRALRRYLINVTTVAPTLFQRAVGKSFWQVKIALWKLRGLLDSHTRSLSVGSRWITEIAFFRKIVGLKTHIGLDLFSDDSKYVTAGDMHSMPFPDNEFQFIFIKNTTDKSYDLRRLVSELIRVTRPGGIIVVDQICGYGYSSPLTRTDIQSADNLLRVFKAQMNDVKPLVQDTIDLDKVKTGGGRDKSTRNVRLAVRIGEKEAK